MSVTISSAPLSEKFPIIIWNYLLSFCSYNTIIISDWIFFHHSLLLLYATLFLGPDIFQGYRKVSSSADQCEDVDECREDSSLCINGRCVNVDGGYRCECLPGYTPSANGELCIGESLPHLSHHSTTTASIVLYFPSFTSRSCSIIWLLWALRKATAHCQLSTGLIFLLALHFIQAIRRLTKVNCSED